jgi:hypothetical protein
MSAVSELTLSVRLLTSSALRAAHADSFVIIKRTKARHRCCFFKVGHRLCFLAQRRWIAAGYCRLGKDCCGFCFIPAIIGGYCRVLFYSVGVW